MSYDLMVFEPTAAPRGREAFKVWYAKQTEWGEGHNYDDPKISSPALQRWYAAISGEYPNMNGREAAGLAYDDPAWDNVRFTDYSIGSEVIYAAFAWSVAEEAYIAVRAAAVSSAVGFYDVSGDEGDGEIYFPGDRLRPPSNGTWREISKQFRDLKGSE